MLIKSIEIHKCKRFPLYGKDTLTAEFNKPAIMIKGINGSGKTSLFSFLTPLPMDKKDFEEGGFFRIVILYQNSTYTLTSSFVDKTPNYSFNVDGEELNESGNISSQRLLVELNFGITQNIFDFMYGRELFTETNLAGRKKLFSTFTKLNIDNVLRGYSKLNEQLNLHKLMLKNELKQLKGEEAKLLEEGDYNKLASDLKEIHGNIDYLLDMRSNFSRYFNPESSESSLLDLKELLEKKRNVEIRYFTLITMNPHGSIEMRREVLREKITTNKSKLDYLYRELENFQIMERSMTDNEIEDKETLGTKIEILQENIERNEGFILYVSPDYWNDSYIESIYFRLHESLNDIINDMEVNFDGETNLYSKAKLDIVISKIDKLTEEFKDLTSEERVIISNIQKAKELNVTLQCPDCDHEWHMKDIIKVDNDRKKVVEFRARRAEIEKEVKELMEYRDRCEKFYNQFKIIQQLKNETYKYIPGYWDTLEDKDSINKSPMLYITKLNGLNSDQMLIKKNIELRNEVKLLLENIKLIESFNGNNPTNVKDKITVLNEQILTIISETRQYQKELDDIELAKTVYDIIEKLNRSINMTKDCVREFNLSTVTSSILVVIDKQLRDLRLRASELDGVVHSQDSIQYTIKGIKDKVVDIEETIHVLDITLKELSPKNGIIAKTISSFMNTIINNVNKTLERMWSYKMVLKPIDLEHSDLNYKFKIRVEDSLDVDDIALASKGMKEAINLAFKLVLYKLHGFNDYPLYLDELASNMDEGHTAKMSQLVHSFVYESDFSQVFIISHKENMGFIKDVDVVELS